MDELEGAKRFGRNGNLAPTLGAALQGPNPDRGGLEEAPALVGGEVLAAAGVDELEIADQTRHFAWRSVRERPACWWSQVQFQAGAASAASSAKHGLVFGIFAALDEFEGEVRGHRKREREYLFCRTSGSP